MVEFLIFDPSVQNDTLIFLGATIYVHGIQNIHYQYEIEIVHLR